MTVRARGRVDVAPLRDAFLRSRLSASEVCVWLEWHTRTGRPDTNRFMRALGLVANTTHGQRVRARSIGVDRAALIADALGVDPWEIGI